MEGEKKFGSVVEANPPSDSLGEAVAIAKSSGDRPGFIDYNKASTISIQPDTSSKMGENRQDIVTSARDAEGHVQDPGSWLMMGYNKAGHKIEMGDYISLEEVSKAIADLLESVGDGARIVRHEPPMDFPDVSSAIQDILANVLAGHSGIRLTPDDTMPKHNAHGTELQDTEGRTFKSSNILLKKEVQLPDGNYVHRPTLDKTIGNYAIRSSFEIPLDSGQQYNDNQDKEEQEYE